MTGAQGDATATEDFREVMGVDGVEGEADATVRQELGVGSRTKDMKPRDLLQAAGCMLQK